MESRWKAVKEGWYKCLLCGTETNTIVPTCEKGCTDKIWWELKTGIRNDTFRNPFVDEFLTQEAVAQAVVNCVPDLPKQNPSILDPGANIGTFGKYIKQRWPRSLLWGIEYLVMDHSRDYDRWINTDYLDYNYHSFLDLIVGNPPYSDYRSGVRKTVVDDWVKHSLFLLKSSGYLVFLLRTNISHGIERFKPGGIHHDFGYLEEIPIAPRPNFYEEDNRVNAHGDAPSHDYSVFIWQKDNYKERKYLDWKKTLDF